MLTFGFYSYTPAHIIESNGCSNSDVPKTSCLRIRKRASSDCLHNYLVCPADRRREHALKLHHLSHLMLLVCTSMTLLPAHARIYKAEDAVNRVTIYSNVPIRFAPAKLESPKLGPSAPSTTARSAPAPAPASAATPTPTPTVVPPPVPRAKVGVKSLGSVASDYPRIAPAVQKARDSERLAILADELLLEQSLLAEALSRKAAAEVIQRYTSNIEALKREIESTKQ